MRLIAACLLLCLFAPALSAQDQSLETLYLDPALKTGDLDTHAGKLAKLLHDKPSLPVLRRWQEIEDDVSDPRPIYIELARLAKAGFASLGAEADEFVAEYIKLARRFSTELSWQTTAREWAGLTQVAFVGPFADGTASVHDDVFSPEVLLDYGAEYEGPYGPVRWTTLRAPDDLKGELRVYDQQRWTGYGYYLATSLVSDEDRSALIKLKLNGPGKAWLDGECLLDADSRRAQQPGEFFLRVKLHRGRNQFMVKLSSLSGVSIRLRGDDGLPLRNVIAMVPGAEDKPVVIHSSVPLKPVTVLPTGLTDLSALVGSGDSLTRQQTLALLAYAAEAEVRGLSDAADDAAGRALAALPDEPLVQLEFLHAIDKGRLYGGSDRRKIVRTMTEQMLAADETLVPAAFEMATLLASDERYREAIALLQGTLEHTPAQWRVYLHMAEVFHDANWRPENESAIKSALRLAPAALPVLQAASNYYAAIGAQDREIAMDSKRLEVVPGDPDAHLSLANTLARTGDVDGALKHLRGLVAADPRNDFLLRRLGEALAANGNVSEALEVYETLANQKAQPEEALYEAARICLQLGREEQGVKYLERVLQADPGHHVARRELQRIRGESEDVWSKYALTWDQIMQHDVTAKQFPRAASALILDEQIQYMFADGSTLNYIHQVRKILTQDAVDTRGKETITGELVIARTVQADGTVLEPISQPGGLIEFPGVQVGAYLDVAYLTRSNGGPLKTLDGDAFFFMDQSLSEPFAISRWVLIAPKDKQLNVMYHNLRPEDEGVTIASEPVGERIVHTWDVRNPRMPEQEAFMPPPPEFVPWIECVHPRDWRDRARKLAVEGLRDIMDTGLIRTKAKLLTADAKTPEQKVRALYEWVNATITTEGDAWNAHQALKAGAGDRRELFLSLCAAAGVRLAFAYVDAAPPYKTAPNDSLPRPHWAYPNDQDFAEFYFVVLGDDAADVFVDLSDRLRPFGAIPARRFNAPAIIWRAGVDGKPGDYALGHLPGGDREKDRFENKVTIQLHEDGSATLEGSINVRGERSYAMKEAMRNTPNDKLRNELEATLAQQYQGFEAGECEFPGLGDVGKPLVQGYKGSVRKLATKTDDGLSLELPGEKLGRLMSILVGSRKRESDIVLNFDLVQTDEIRIKPPEGYAFAGVPEDLVYPTAPLTYEMKFRIEDGELVVTRKLALGPGRFQPAEYSDLVEQVKQVKQAEDSTLKLVKQ